MKIDKAYEPKEVEKRVCKFWEEESKNLFSANEDLKSSKKPFSIVIPPPNVTGVLHIGHSLNATIQDILCRYKRLKGYDVLWIPGTDHAGIATQNVVEKKLLAEDGIKKEDIGKDKFLEKVWQWKEQSGGTIINQFKRLGVSCDWDKERFTMDGGLSKAVRKSFVELYKQNLIYRSNYIINWCPRCLTAISDEEVEHEENEGFLYYIKYTAVDSDEFLVVATTRPETMFGDSAVAINPADERYKNLKIKRVVVPLIEREIPIIKDNYVDVEFGTGALKITPAHDFNDFEIGRKHNLPEIKAFDNSAIMTIEAGEFLGLDRFECRKKTVKALEEKGLLLKKEKYVNNIGHCYRCKTIIEPNLSVQWFVNVKPLAEKAIKAVKEKKINIIPSHWEKTYFEWMYNIRDWCISRQIWWGHRIPAWFCDDCGEIIVSEETPKNCTCGNKNLREETDVLDTWFSSGLWPFSTMGWPDKTDLLEKYYPTSVLVTSFDILFFWVARMAMMGIHLVGEIPFKDVYLHALVRDENGKKMSKSIGNVIDPLLLIENYGTDALRFTLAAFAAQGRDIKMSIERVEGYRFFINKIWNSARFAFIHIDEDVSENIDTKNLTLENVWILSELDGLSKGVSKKLDEYKFNEAATLLYKFVWHKFCDWYLEAIKPSLYGKKGIDAQKNSKAVLLKVLKDTLILLHPFIPFITEEIWLKLTNKNSIMLETYPDLNFYNEEKEKDMEFLMGIISGIRNVRSEMNISPAKEMFVVIRSKNSFEEKIIAENKSLIEDLAKVKLINEDIEKSVSFVVRATSVFILLGDVIDFEKEKKRLQLSIDKIDKEIGVIEKKLQNKNFLNKAPKDVVEKEREKSVCLKEKKDKVFNNLKKILSI